MNNSKEMTKSVLDIMKSKGYSQVDAFMYIRNNKAIMDLIIEYTMDKDPSTTQEKLAEIIVTDILSLPIV